ncbi:MAG: protein kinase [Deltaproteobacteria bacterium]|jgi:serine/threonine protein kinase|nr:protein kinase [Deltaproteobacteria bacterium]MBW2533163.1 protein kinase [Deltaproteobacteria bacterium]
MATASTALAVGEIIAGRYEIEERLGEGGMAVVYRARHTGTGRPCAIKFLLPQLAEVDKHREQFLNEARVAGRIGSHPNVVDVFDTGIDRERQLPYIAMELLQGMTLSDFASIRGWVAWDVAGELLGQLAEALDAAHRADVIHRDLKPNNVFVSEDHKGALRVKVLDFGIAKLLEGTESDRTATQVGTPWYSAPEQLGSSMRKLAAERGITITMGVSPATDVWAFGLVAFELLTGLQPKKYWGSLTMADQMIKVALDDRALPSERAGERAEHLPPGFDEWFLRCIRHNAEERFPSVGEAMEALGGLLAGEPPTVRGAELPGAAEAPTTPIGQMSPIAGGIPSPTPASPPDTPVPAVTPEPGPRQQPDTASSWQEVGPAPATSPRTAWIAVGGAALAIGIGATVAALTIRTGPTNDNASAPAAESAAPTAEPAEPAPEEPAEPAPTTPATTEPGGEGGGQTERAAPEPTTTAEAAPTRDRAPVTTPPWPTAAAAPAQPTSSPKTPEKGFDDLFGER